MARKKKVAVYEESFKMQSGPDAKIRVYPFGQRFIAYFSVGRHEMPVEASTSATTALDAAVIARGFMRTTGALAK